MQGDLLPNGFHGNGTTWALNIMSHLPLETLDFKIVYNNLIHQGVHLTQNLEGFSCSAER